MSIAKVIEVLAEGDSIEAAVQLAVSEAAETVRGIKHVYVEGVQALGHFDEDADQSVHAQRPDLLERALLRRLRRRRLKQTNLHFLHKLLLLLLKQYRHNKSR